MAYTRKDLNSFSSIQDYCYLLVYLMMYFNEEIGSSSSKFLSNNLLFGGQL